MRNGNLLRAWTSEPNTNVLTVPMRNGNVRVSIDVFTDAIVLTVPMRNGNYEAIGRKDLYEATRSYRTYEEWKLCTRAQWKMILSEFLPYLWGMETSQNGLLFEAIGSNRSSYRTYEEWKLPTIYEATSYLSFVLTVPMRNGNFIMYWSKTRI